MAKEEKRSFVLYYDYRIHLQILTDEERGKLLMALMDYGEKGKEPEFEGAALMAFSFITLQMDKDAERYAETCRKRSEAGKKGGRPPKETDASEDENEEEEEPPKKQPKAKKAKGFSKIIPLPPLTPPPEGNAPKGAEPEAEAEPAPYKEIVGLYHEICTSYPKLRSVSANRKKAISARWKEHEGNLDIFRELFTKAEASRFLKGESEGGSGWTADFNWLMNSDNMAKVLEGNFDMDKQERQRKQQSQKGSFDTDEFFEVALARSLREQERNWLRQEPPVTESELKRMQNPPKTAAEDEVVQQKADDLKRRLGQTGG